MKILIFGASGAGSTTLGKLLATKLDWKHLDSDEYYWKKTFPPFQTQINKTLRNKAITNDFNSSPNLFLSGSMLTWDAIWANMFDLAVFLHIPMEIRMRRLKKREVERYGDLLISDYKIKRTSEEFLDWATKYDDQDFTGRSISQHKKHIEMLSCPVLKILGDTTNEERINLVTKKIHQN